VIATQSRPERVYGPVDYLLTGVYACLAAFATGVSVGSTTAAWMFVGIIAAGTLFSFTVQWLIGDQPVSKYDGLMYLAVGLAVFFFREDLAKMVPDQPFQEQLLLTGTFSWLLALGSFFTWRDGTLLFQAVPSIALFGMVGIFDTFKAVPFLFFALLVCLATLFARAHRRQMVEQAEASGYKAMLAREEAAQTQGAGGARLQAILQGPWRWMAGPEWALVSALVIVLISLVGAPSLQLALRPIAGTIHIPPPPLTASQAPALLGRPDAGRVLIGQGPTTLGDKIVLTADTDQKRYLRIRTYGTYEGFGWENVNTGVTASAGAMSNVVGSTLSIYEMSVRVIKNRVRVPFKVTVLERAITGIPVPGEIALPSDIGPTMQSDVRPYRNNDGTYQMQLISANDVIPPFGGQATVSANGVVPKNAVKADDLPVTMSSYLEVPSAFPKTVVDLAISVSKDKKNDYEKAQAIQREIESRCLYNLKAPKTPGGVDPIENFLFNTKQGYCDLFASSMTMMARAAGIPARYVTGFYPIKGTRTADGTAYAISEAEAHAWCELFFEDVGWVAFDATEGALQAPGDGLGDPTTGAAWYKQAWFRTSLDVAIAAFVLLGGLYALLMYRKNMKSRVPSRADVGREYTRFVAIVQRLSKRRRLPSQTPTEYLTANKQVFGEHITAAERLTGKFVGALYSPDEVNESILKELREDTEQLRRDIRAKENGKPMAGLKN
jgi:transglutaminase-like putative cysteine protease